jgi:hypothetical protein
MAKRGWIALPFAAEAGSPTEEQKVKLRADAVEQAKLMNARIIMELGEQVDRTSPGVHRYVFRIEQNPEEVSVSWRRAFDRARQLAEDRGVRYVVFGYKLNGQWIYYPASTNSLTAQRRHGPYRVRQP